MTLPNLKMYLWVLSILITTILATDLICPTITRTTHHPNCPAPTPSFCPTPLCIIESLMPVPCGCPAAMPTSMLYTACPTKCEEGCGTYYNAVLAPCTSTSGSTVLPTTVSVPTTTLSTVTTTTAQPSTCSTVTISAGPACWTEGCGRTYSRCRTTEMVTLECGCKTIPTVTSCSDKKTCDGGCITSFQTGYLPCPYTSLPAPTTF